MSSPVLFSPFPSTPVFKRLRAPSMTHDISPFTPSHPSPLRQTFSAAAESLLSIREKDNERRGNYVYVNLGEIQEEEVVVVEVISPDSEEGSASSMEPPPVIQPITTEVPREVKPTKNLSPKRRPSELALPAHPNAIASTSKLSPIPQPIPSSSNLPAPMLQVPLTSPMAGLYSAGLPARLADFSPSHLTTLFSAGLNAFTPPASSCGSGRFLDELIDLYINTPYSALLELSRSSPLSSKFSGNEVTCYSSLLSPSYFLKSPL